MVCLIFGIDGNDLNGGNTALRLELTSKLDIICDYDRISEGKVTFS